MPCSEYVLWGRWKRRIWLDTDTDAGMDNFKIHFYIYTTLPNAVFTAVFASKAWHQSFIHLYKHRGEGWTISLRMLQTIILSYICSKV